MALKYGMVVRVYQRPQTDEDFEGEALLVEHYKHWDDHGSTGLENWLVRFKNGDEAPRLVHERNVVKD